jgi:RsiW-degrading membrane proteinase PrsW (M82 family)
MSIWIILSGIIAPAIFWLGYLYFKDRVQPEPFRTTGTTYILGIFAAILAIQLFKFLPLLGIPEDPSALMETNRLKFLFYSIGLTGFIEEFCKFLPFFFIVLRFKFFDEEVDGIIYASIIALGFASYENSRYLVYLEGLELFGRAFASPLTHAIFASIWGYAVGVAWLRSRSVLKASVLGIGLAALCHGLFNYLTTSPILRVGASILILIIWIWQIRLIERLRHRSNRAGNFIP